MKNIEQKSTSEPSPTEEVGIGKVEENRDEQFQKLVDFLDKINAKEVLGDGEERKGFIESLDFNGFKDLLIRVNGIVRDIPIGKRKFDGTTVRLTGWTKGYVPPSYEDKEPLLEEVFFRAKGLDDIKDEAFLISASINAIHPFADGNGRTSRLAYFLIGWGYHGSEEEKSKLSKILGDNGRDGLDVNPLIIEEKVLDIIKKEELGLDSANPKDPMGMWETNKAEKLKFKEDVSKKDEAMFREMVSLRQGADTYGYGFIAVYKYLKDAGRLNNKYFKTFFNRDGQPVRTRMLTAVVSEDLTSKDIKRIADVHRELKRKYIQKLVDIISNPQKYPSGETSGGTLKDYFKSRVEW